VLIRGDVGGRCDFFIFLFEDSWPVWLTQFAIIAHELEPGGSDDVLLRELRDLVRSDLDVLEHLREWLHIA